MITTKYLFGLAATWATENPILDFDTVGIETDTQRFKIGNGVLHYNDTVYHSVIGVQGIPGEKGDTGDIGPQGNPGPNQVTTSTACNINGILKGDGSYIAVASVSESDIADAISKKHSNSLDHAGSTQDTAIAGKVTANDAITSATKTKVTYDAKGLITGGTDATTADIADSSDKRYCTDAQKTVISNTSGTNTGDTAGHSALAPIDNPTFTTKITTPQIVSTGSVLSSGGGLGYATGAGGTVTQATSRTTAVTLNKLCGNITMFSAAQAAQALVTFTLTNSFIAATDLIDIRHISATNGGAWNISVVPAAGSCTINIRNVSTASITEATPLRFQIHKGVTA